MKVSGSNLGFCHTIFGITKELTGDLQSAYRYHAKALEVWKTHSSEAVVVDLSPERIQAG